MPYPTPKRKNLRERVDQIGYLKRLLEYYFRKIILPATFV